MEEHFHLGSEGIGVPQTTPSCDTLINICIPYVLHYH